MVFADNSLFGCGNLLKEKANIPHIVDFSCWGFNDIYNWQYGVIWPVSHVPADEKYDESYGITFQWRLYNTFAYLIISAIGRAATMFGTSSLKRKYGIAADKTYTQLISETDLVLIPVDWALEYPRPVPPSKLNDGIVHCYVVVIMVFMCYCGYLYKL